MINIKKISPMFNQIVTTADQYTEDQTIGGIITDVKKSVGTLKEYQKVVATGPMVRNIKVGDLVLVNPRRYAQVKHQEGSLKDGVITDNPVVRYNFPMIELDHVKHLLLQDSDVDFVIEEYEEEEDVKKEPSSLIIKDNSVIV